MSRDWYPRSRDEQLHMMKAWNAQFQLHAAAWGIPQAHVTTLANNTAAAESILDTVKSGERTASNVVQCNTVFNDMEAEARFIKRHYLLLPPLTLADLPNLLLPLPDEVHSPVGKPAGQPVITITYPGGPHVLLLHLGPLAGTAPIDKRGDYGYAVYRGIMPQGGATLEQAAGVKHYLMKPAASGDGLLHCRFTRRKKEAVNFAAEESGMTAYFCARYENQKGDCGDWGTAASAVIP